MHVSRVNSVNFQANLNFPPNYIKYIEKNSVAREGYKDFTSHKVLINKLTEAFSKNPSDANVNVGMLLRNNEMFCARGLIGSQYAEFTDTEPARDDSVAAFENVVRRILHPDNRVQFNKLMGAKRKSPEQDVWWNTYIAPIWKDISSEFYETTYGPRLFDGWYNKAFRMQRKV